MLEDVLVQTYALQQLYFLARYSFHHDELTHYEKSNSLSDRDNQNSPGSDRDKESDRSHIACRGRGFTSRVLLL
jgi:hypothetical protein